MTQLVCNGVRLDLYDNTSLQYKHNNPLFAFDDLQCERTTQFKLPCTPTNDSVLSLARIPAYAGTGMRRKFAAQMTDGTVVKDGYLYVSAYDGKDYTAIFVTGELVGLQKIKDLGKLSDIISYNNYTVYNNSGTSAPTAVGMIWQTVFYKRPSGAYMHPSIELATLYNDILTANGITAAALPGGANGVRIIPNELRGIQQTGITFESRAFAMATDGTYPVCCDISVGALDYMFTVQGAKVERIIGVPAHTVYTGTVQQFKCNQDITLKFPDTWDDNLFVGYFIDGGSYFINEFTFYGDRSFDANHVVTGDSLKGREVTIPMGQAFTIISINDYANEDTSSGHMTGWGLQGQYTDLLLSGSVNALGAWVRLQDNLPDITFVELLQTIAALSGRVLDYTETSGVTYEDLDTDTYTIHDIELLQDRGEVKRVFSNYSRHNIVRFDDENIFQPLQADYTIDNDNIDAESELQVVPFSEGDNNDGLIFVTGESDVPYLCMNIGDIYLGRVSLPKNAGLQQLCTASTQYKIDCVMTLAEYNSITEKTLLLVDNTLYVWTDRSYQKNVAKFTLAKVL